MSDWLPSLILMEDNGEDWDAYLEALYQVFRSDFLCQLPPFDGRRLGLKKAPEHMGKACTFWHFISEGKTEEDRIPDFRRCERIGWPRKLIDEANAGSDRVLVWTNVRGRYQRWLIALPDFSYVVVLEDRGDYLLPWTAYCVENDRKRTFRREYEAWLKKAEAALP